MSDPSPEFVPPPPPPGTPSPAFQPPPPPSPAFQPPPAYPPPPAGPPAAGYQPPPPPPGMPPPAFQPPPGYAPPVAYQPTAAYQPPAGYQAAPGYAAAPYPAAWAPGQSAAAAMGGTGALLSQFGGIAAWSIGIGVVAIVVPLVSSFYFPILPIVGALNGWRAIVRGRMIGGLVGIGLNIVAGILSLIASGLLLGGQ